MTDYANFLAAKAILAPPTGRTIALDDVHPLLHTWQAESVQWAAQQGRAAIFWDCGLGKSFAQLEWARLMADTSLIVAPLSVARQTVREATKLDIDVRYVRSSDDVTDPGVWITNYEMIEHFDASIFGAVVLDESSILKNYVGAIRTSLIDRFSDTPYRLACTATPAPNDVAELTNHAEFLGVMSRVDMLAAYFIHDSDVGWRIKGHAERPMYEWMRTWSQAVRMPGDLGYPNDGYELPAMTIDPVIVDAVVEAEGQLFPTELGGVGGRATVRRATLDSRVSATVDIVNQHSDEQIIVWCGLNDESSALARAIPDAVNVEGSWAPDAKAAALEAFQDGEIRVLVSKPKIAGFGMNFQNARRMIFCGVGDSYESYYQCIRRCYRFGQQREVIAHIVVSELEQQIIVNVRRKERDAQRAISGIINAMQGAIA